MPPASPGRRSSAPRRRSPSGTSSAAAVTCACTASSTRAAGSSTCLTPNVRVHRAPVEVVTTPCEGAESNHGMRPAAAAAPPGTKGSHRNQATDGHSPATPPPWPHGQTLRLSDDVDELSVEFRQLSGHWRRRQGELLIERGHLCSLGTGDLSPSTCTEPVHSSTAPQASRLQARRDACTRPSSPAAEAWLGGSDTDSAGHDRHGEWLRPLDAAHTSTTRWPCAPTELASPTDSAEPSEDWSTRACGWALRTARLATITSASRRRTDKTARVSRNNRPDGCECPIRPVHSSRLGGSGQRRRPGPDRWSSSERSERSVETTLAQAEEQPRPSAGRSCTD